MLIAYTDASVQGKTTYLAFKIEFEDNKSISRRIVIGKKKTHVAEVLAIGELCSFLKWYGFRNGVILLDNQGTKEAIERNKKGIYKQINNFLNSHSIKLQFIPRRYNLAHNIAYNDKYVKSEVVSSINPTFLSFIIDYPDYYVDVPVFEKYRKMHPRKSKSFHKFQKGINQKIWLGETIFNENDISVYAYYDLIIILFKGTVIEISQAIAVKISNHYRVIRRKKKYSKAKRKYLKSGNVDYGR
jgi:hypothetical protein